ncbi:MAG: cytidine deaminase [Flavobacteriaceae bacterium]|nr:cytidine deaminase [Flavobacteriaceae bacterium]
MKKQILITYNVLHKEELNEIENALFVEALKARKNAYAPYSQFLVGCSLLLENGKIYTGNNQENAAYPSGLCAERSILYWIGANHPEQKIEKLFIVGGAKENPNLKQIVPPCGSCRQSILEYENKQQSNIEIYIASLDGKLIYKINSTRDLLPFSFDANFL